MPCFGIKIDFGRYNKFMPKVIDSVIIYLRSPC